MKRFALIGAAGYIAPRHMKAIKETGNVLVAAMDKHDAVGVLDNYFPEAEFFTEFERFERHLEKLNRSGKKIDYLTVCTPNYLHDAHIRLGLKLGADVVCEKPVVINPWNIEALEAVEKDTGRNVYTIMQLRHHPSIRDLKQRIGNGKAKHEVALKYFTPRGKWYHSSWKGDIFKSGGIATNIGIHFFDLLTWIFGAVKESRVTDHTSETASGELVLDRATVNWQLSIRQNDLPEKKNGEPRRVYRLLSIDGKEIDFSEHMEDLHISAYKNILDGKGFTLNDCRQSIQLAHDIRNSIQ